MRPPAITEGMDLRPRRTEEVSERDAHTPVGQLVAVAFAAGEGCICAR
jgi:hypothetical protein